MIGKSFVFALLVVGALAEYQVTDEQRQQARTAITNYCKKNGAEDKASDVEKGVENFINCAKSLFDMETIKKEIEEARPNGALDEVFKKYCAKTPQLKECIHTLSSAVAPCVEESMRDKVNTFNNATDQLLDFVCYKDGDRIALFIAEGGPECFQEKANKIRECGQKLKDSVTDVESARKLSETEQCAKFDELTSCIVRALEECSTPTPGNMAESLFRFVRNGSPCSNKKS